MNLGEIRDASVSASPDGSDGGAMRWIALAGVIMALNASMPIVHQQVFGVERMATAFVEAFERSEGVRVAPAGRARLAAELGNRPQALKFVGAAFVSLFSLAAAGLLLNAASLILGVTVSGRRCLEIAAYASLGVTLLRIGGWGIALALVGRDGSAAIDWLHVTPMNVTGFGDLGGGYTMRSVLASLDAYRGFGVLLSAILLRESDETASVLACVMASLPWVVLLALLSGVASNVLGVPIV